MTGPCYEAQVYDQARTYCASCPVQTECLTDAIAQRDFEGFRGGSTPSERERARRPGFRAYCAVCSGLFQARNRLQVVCETAACRRARHNEIKRRADARSAATDAEFEYLRDGLRGVLAELAVGR